MNSSFTCLACIKCDVLAFRFKELFFLFTYSDFQFYCKLSVKCCIVYLKNRNPCKSLNASINLIVIYNLSKEMKKKN